MLYVLEEPRGEGDVALEVLDMFEMAGVAKYGTICVSYHQSR